MAAGGGFDPRLLLCNALVWSGRGTEADTDGAALVALAAPTPSELKRRRSGWPR